MKFTSNKSRAKYKLMHRKMRRQFLAYKGTNKHNLGLALFKKWVRAERHYWL